MAGAIKALASANEALRRDAIRAVVRWMAVVPSRPQSEVNRRRAQREDPRQGWVLILTSLGTYHTATIEYSKRPKGDFKHRTNVLVPAEPHDSLLGVGSSRARGFREEPAPRLEEINDALRPRRRRAWLPRVAPGSSRLKPRPRPRGRPNRRTMKRSSTPQRPLHEERLDRFASSCVRAFVRDRRVLFLDSFSGGRWGPLQVTRRQPDGGAILARVVSLVRSEAVLVASVEISSVGEVVVATLLPDWRQRVLRLTGERLEMEVLATDELKALTRALDAFATLRRSALLGQEGGTGAGGDR